MNNPNHFNLIYRLSQALSSSLDLDDVLDKVMDEVVTATHAERGFIMLTEQASGESGVRRTFYATRGLDHKEIEAPGFLTSRSVVEQVEREGEPMLTSDAQRDARLASRQSVVLLKLRSILCVPIRTQQRGLGVIYVDSRVMTGIFTQAELELLTTIASHAAVTIENARLFRETQNQLQILRTIYEIAADLTSTLDMQRVLEACLQRVMKLLSAHAASILTIEGEELVFRVALGEKSAEIKPFRIPRGEGIAGWVVEHKQGAMVNDVRADNRFRSTTDQETGFITECLLAAPLMVNERSIGVIEVFNKPGGFQQSDLDMQ